MVLHIYMSQASPRWLFMQREDHVLGGTVGRGCSSKTKKHKAMTAAMTGMIQNEELTEHILPRRSSAAVIAEGEGACLKTLQTAAKDRSSVFSASRR